MCLANSAPKIQWIFRKWQPSQGVVEGPFNCETKATMMASQPTPPNVSPPEIYKALLTIGFRGRLTSHTNNTVKYIRLCMLEDSVVWWRTGIKPLQFIRSDLSIYSTKNSVYYIHLFMYIIYFCKNKQNHHHFTLKAMYSPENEHFPWILMVGRFSFLLNMGPFSGDIR